MVSTFICFSKHFDVSKMYLSYFFLGLEKRLQIAESFGSCFDSLANNLIYRTTNHWQRLKEL